MKSEMPTSPPVQKHWLVVDDDEGVRESMAALLEITSGVQVARFSSATAALPVFTAAPGQYSFIITDFEMPGMNGVEFCRRARALAPAAKVLRVTGNAAINEAEARQLGFCGLLAKPFSAAALWRAVAAAEIAPARENNFSKQTAASLAA